LLVNLRANLGDKLEMDSIIFQINEWLTENEGVLSPDLEKKIKDLVNKLSDKAVKAAFSSNEYEQAKQEIIMFFPTQQQSQVQDIFNQMETTNPTPEQIKQYLSQILKIAKQDVES
jgi:hypothetical protein